MGLERDALKSILSSVEGGGRGRCIPMEREGFLSRLSRGGPAATWVATPPVGSSSSSW